MIDKLKKSVVADFWGKEALKNILSWPDENLVRFLGSNFPEPEKNRGFRALEIGCGNGRNLFALEKHAFQTWGIEISEDAADNCIKILNAANSSVEIVKGAFEETNFGDEFFNLLVWDSPYLETVDGIKHSLGIACKTLVQGGYMWIKFRHPDSWFSKLGIQKDEFTVYPDKRAGPYAGSLYSFFTEKQAKQILEKIGFLVFNSERVELWKKNSSERHVWTVFWVRADHGEG